MDLENLVLLWNLILRKTLKKLINDLLDIQQVENVLSLLDVPLLEPSDNLSLSEVADQVTTLNSDNADISKAKRVFSSNQVYKNLLISEFDEVLNKLDSDRKTIISDSLIDQEDEDLIQKEGEYNKLFFHQMVSA